MLINADVLELDISHDDALPNIVIVHLDVLCSGMEDWVSRLLYATLIVVVDMYRFVDRFIEVL